MRIQQLWISTLVSLLVFAGLASCNTTKEDDPDYMVSSNVAVSNFYIKKGTGGLSNIDSVFFSIDLNRRLIFNADSLPKGTDVTRLIPVISLPGSASQVRIIMEGGTYRTGEVDYIENPTDSIDFTGRVTLSILAQDGVSACDYLVKVNVHQMEPDSLWWDRLAVTELPARLPNPIAQRTVDFDGHVTTFVAENDGTYTMSYTDEPSSAQWVNQKIDFGFVPDLRSVAATDDRLYVLSDEEMLYESVDGVTWNATSQQWNGIIGGYQDRLLGLVKTADGVYHAEYPVSEGFVQEKVDEEFPIEGYSQFHIYSNKWMESPTGLLTGGMTQSGRLTGATWGYDGKMWAKLSTHEAPAVKGGTMIPYFVYRNNSALWLSTEYSIWMFVGGQLADGTFNRKMYMTYDNGVNWIVCGDLMQLPDYIPGMMNTDCAIVSVAMSGNFEPEGWTAKASKNLPGWYRVNYEVDGYDVAWECPYIYLFGGQDADGVTYNTVWKGVLNRLTFVPIF